MNSPQMNQRKKIIILLFFLATFLMGTISRLANFTPEYDIIVLFAGLIGTLFQLVQLYPDLLKNLTPKFPPLLTLLTFLRAHLSASIYLLLVVSFVLNIILLFHIGQHSCYDQAKSIGSMPVVSTPVFLSGSYSVDPASACQDINFKPAQPSSQIEARVVFLDVNTGEVKGYGRTWVPLKSSGWMILAMQIKRGTRYTLEFRTTSGNGVIEGKLAA
jgi:hypothetical protein